MKKLKVFLVGVLVFGWGCVAMPLSEPGIKMEGSSWMPSTEEMQQWIAAADNFLSGKNAADASLLVSYSQRYHKGKHMFHRVFGFEYTLWVESRSPNYFLIKPTRSSGQSILIEQSGGIISLIEDSNGKKIEESQLTAEQLKLFEKIATRYCLLYDWKPEGVVAPSFNELLEAKVLPSEGQLKGLTDAIGHFLETGTGLYIYFRNVIYPEGQIFPYSDITRVLYPELKTGFQVKIGNRLVFQMGERSAEVYFTADCQISDVYSGKERVPAVLSSYLDQLSRLVEVYQKLRDWRPKN